MRKKTTAIHAADTKRMVGLGRPNGNDEHIIKTTWNRP